MAITTIVLARFPLEPLPIAFVFVAAWLTYTMNRFTDRIEDAHNVPDRSAFIDRYGRPLLAVAGISYAGFVVLTLRYVPRMMLFVVLPVLGILAYARPAVKRHFAIKNGAVGAIWAAIPVGLGVYYGALTDPIIVLTATVIFWHITLAAALFDIKDIEGDRAIGSRTLPLVFSPGRTRQLVMVGALLLVIPIGWGIFTIGWWSAILGGYVFHLLVVAPFATAHRGSLFYGIVIDGEHLAVAILAIIIGM